MKTLWEIVASLNVTRSNDCSKEKSEEFKSIIQDLLPYAKLEDRLDIDLITLISVFDKGFYAWVKDEEHDEPYLFHFDAKDLELCIEGKSLIVYEQCSEEVYGEYDFKDYGKTWALTKEELL